MASIGSWKLHLFKQVERTAFVELDIAVSWSGIKGRGVGGEIRGLEPHRHLAGDAVRRFESGYQTILVAR